LEKCRVFVVPVAGATGTDWACAVATAKKPIAATPRTVKNGLRIEVSSSRGCIAMYNPTGVKTSPQLSVPGQMKAWVLGGPDELFLRDKPTPVPARAEVLVRIDAVAICATDLEVIHSGSPASIQGGLPFNKNFTPGHEYMGTVAALGPDVDEFAIGERVSVEIHAGCGQCKRCRQGMYTSCLNYGRPEKGHRANGFTTDGGFAEYAINHINTLVRVPDTMSDPEATLVVTAGTSMYGLTELGGLVAGESVVVIGPGPIGLLAVAVAKALGASPVILTGTRNKRLAIGQELGADRVVNINDEDAVEVVKQLTGGIGADYVIECAGSEATIDQAIHMTNRGGKICLAAFPHEPVTTDIAHLVRNNIYVYGIRGEGRSATHRAMELMAEKRFDATRIHTHTFPLADLPTALRYARERVEDAIKVVITNKQAGAIASAAAE
jgi:2-desacetyl-2-hydroxyethyl bacteriochlorophyllide A dehydrogenase